MSRCLARNATPFRPRNRTYVARVVRLRVRRVRAAAVLLLLLLGLLQGELLLFLLLLAGNLFLAPGDRIFAIRAWTEFVVVRSVDVHPRAVVRSPLEIVFGCFSKSDVGERED